MREHHHVLLAEAVSTAALNGAGSASQAFWLTSSVICALPSHQPGVVVDFATLWKPSFSSSYGPDPLGAVDQPFSSEV